MNTCLKCETTKSKKWKRGYCNSCYMKIWRNSNLVHIIEYDSSGDRRYKKAQRIAKKRKIDWQITFFDYLKLCNQSCFYCDNKLGKIVLYNIGLDRLDNNKGYIIDNVVSCCESCNMVKGDSLSCEEMKKVAELLISMRSLNKV
jgi:hypothetical protein